MDTTTSLRRTRCTDRTCEVRTTSRQVFIWPHTHRHHPSPTTTTAGGTSRSPDRGFRCSSDEASAACHCVCNDRSARVSRPVCSVSWAWGLVLDWAEPGRVRSEATDSSGTARQSKALASSCPVCVRAARPAFVLGAIPFGCSGSRYRSCPSTRSGRSRARSTGTPGDPERPHP